MFDCVSQHRAWSSVYGRAYAWLTIVCIRRKSSMEFCMYISIDNKYHGLMSV